MANNIYKKKDVKLDTFEDLNEKGTIASFSQGDRLSDKLVIKLSNDGVPLDLTDATQVRIDFRKPDGKLVFQYCTMEDKPQGLISCILTTQTLAAPGKVYAEVTVQYPAGKDTVTRQFTFHVEQAIAGDKSLESTDEFPMLAKAIEAGELFEGVDLVAIINAGQLAAAALPKTGGDMTGNLNFQTKSGAKAIQWYNDLAQLGRVIFHPSGLVEWFGKNGATENGAWNYSPTTNTFNVVSNTNLAKKADFYMDDVQANGNTKVLAAATDLNTVQATGKYAGNGLVNTPGGDTGFWYVEVLRYSDTKYCKQVATSLSGGSVSKVFTRRMVNNVWESWYETALVNDVMKKTGDTATGHMTFKGNIIHELLADSNKGIQMVVNNSANKWSVGPKMTGTVDWSKEMALDLNTGKLTVAELATKKDGRTNLTLTADATNMDTGNPPSVIRRGNAVTVRFKISRNVGSASSRVTTLPVDNRPTDYLEFNAIADDGAVVKITIGTAGGVDVYTTGKTVAFVGTFAVD